MPVSPSCVSWISVFPVWTCQSLDKLWIFQVRLATHKYWRAESSETRKTSSTLQACSFFQILSWNSASQPPLFLPSSCSTCLSKHLTHWKFQRIALELGILWKRWFARAFRERFFSCFAIFTWIWTYKTHDLTQYQLTIGSFLPATTFMWSDWQIPGWPQFFQQLLFPSVPSLVNFKCAIIFQRFHLDFLCANLASPITPTQLLLSIFSTLVASQILPVHSLL